MNNVLKLLDEWVIAMAENKQELETKCHSDPIIPHPLTQAKEYGKRIREFKKAIKVLKEHMENEPKSKRSS